MNQNKNKYLLFIQDTRYHYWYAIIIAAFIGIAGQFFFFSKDMTFAYADAVSHLNIARRFFDSFTPGLLSQMGIVWLPIPHLILLPFAHIDFLWISGLAGCIVGYVCFLITAGFAFRVGEVFSPESKIIKWLAFILFVLNPNMIYFQTTAMTEPLFYMFVFGTLLYLVKWEKSRMKIDLIAAGFYSALAMGTRYEGWMMTLFAGFFALLIYRLIGRDISRGAFLYLSFPIFFVVFWFFYNFIFYGDPLAFQRGEYSSEVLMKPMELAGNMPGKGNLWITIVLFFKSIYTSISPIITWIAIIGFIMYFIKYKFNKEKLIPYYTVFGFFIGILSLYFGQVAILLNDQYTRGYFNSRYGLVVFPFIIFFVCFFYEQLSKQKFIKYSLITIIFLNSLIWIIDFPYSAGSIVEANYFLNYRPELRRVSAYFESNYDGKKILFDDKNIVVYPNSKIPMKDRINKYTFQYGEFAIIKPSKIVGWILIDKKVNDEIYEKIKDNVDFKLNYIPVFLDNGVEVYKRR